jgi:hypothetical protein
VKSLQPSCVINFLTMAPASGNGAGITGAGVDESLGAFEAVPASQAQSNPHSASSGTMFLGCIDYLSESLFVSVECLG